MECPYCNAENRDDVRYCSTCGHALQADATLTSTASRSLSPGARLQGGRYVIKSVLGQGGNGAALLATDIRLDSKPVVIKELVPTSSDPARLQDDIRNFKREVATLAHIDHPLVPNVTDHFQEGTRYFMVQEYVEGENLEVRLQQTHQPMKEREALVCASEVLDVLHYLSLQTPPIVHRDIKPANIVVSTRDRRAHLVDFGIARADVARNAQRKQTAALGTPGYAPPEQYQGNADPRSDLYALGATLHHVLTNRDPRDHAPFSYPPVRALNPQLSPEIEQVLQRALINDIDQRYQSASEMKQDIDAILRQRFGVAAAIDSYMLGTSSMAATTNAAGAQTAGIASATQTAPGQAVQLTPRSLATPSGIYTPGTTLQAPRPVQRKRRIWPLFLILLLVVMLVLAGGLYIQHNGSAVKSLTPTPPPNGIGVTRMAGNEYIGISDGTYAFDTTLEDGALKTQAAQLLRQQGDNAENSAVSLLNQATDKNSNDAEALIYKENLRVLNSGRPYITVVVGTMLSGDSATITVGRDDLQGAYVAQQEYNAGFKLHGGMQLRLLIANTGSKGEYVAQVAQQIIQVAHTDPHFVGVMGWPYSDRSWDAIKVLGAAHIPMVSQTASSDVLSGISPYFFRVVPSNNIQGISGAKYAEQTLKVTSAALFYDVENPYSQSLSQDFARQFAHDGNAIVAEEKYTVGKPETLPAALQDALSKHPGMIYFAGYPSDLSTLLTDLPSGSGNLPIMGGDALYELGGYPPSARAGFTHLHFTAFSYPDEWDILGYANKKPAFFSEYSQDFDPRQQHAPGAAYGFTRTDNDVMLSYDATVALLKGADSVLSAGKQQVSPQDLQQALKKVNGSNAFQGVSGQIEFGPDGDPVDKVIVVLYVDTEGRIHMESTSSGRFLQ